MIERVEYYDIRNNPQKANCVLSMEIDKVNIVAEAQRNTTLISKVP